MAIWWLGGFGLFSTPIYLLLAVNGRRESICSPEEILRRRYAAGEIETKEYERGLEELRKPKSAA